MEVIINQQNRLNMYCIFNSYILWQQASTNMEVIISCFESINPRRWIRRRGPSKETIDFENLPEILEEDSIAFFAQYTIKPESQKIEFAGAPLRNEDELEKLFRMHQAPLEVKQVTVTKCYFLKTVPNYIAAFACVTSLNLHDNSIDRLPWSIVMLKHLIVLDLSYNLLTELPKTMGYLSSLEVLNLKANHLKQLPTELLKLEKLKECDVSMNKQLESPPLQICLLGMAEMRKALITRLTRKNLWDRATPWFQYNALHKINMKSLLELCIDTVIACKVDFLGLITVPPIVKSHLTERTLQQEQMIQVCKCNVCRTYFSTKVKFDNHICVPVSSWFPYIFCYHSCFHLWYVRIMRTYQPFLVTMLWPINKQLMDIHVWQYICALLVHSACGRARNIYLTL